ncbi:PA2778 family cysteine peptidase [Saccharospirillum impatiens]|uniref:PA2778 family cysteine peptidase n=1 Tax=Saccharospirillum impatiens TaxID=169438 RepID=UPI00146F3578|nr:PA2778 family cysteine peptidase [Saccharospirillum impatiens]
MSDQVLLEDVPFFPQQTYQCGPATLAMLMSNQGKAVQPEALVDQVFIESRQGSLQAEMLAATRRQGLLPYVHDTRFSTLLEQVDAGHPVLVFQNLGFGFYPVWHYAVVVGYDLTEQEMLLHSGTSAGLGRTFRRFELEWRGGDYWAMTMHRPGEFPSNPEPSAYLEATAGLEQAEQYEAAAWAYQAATERWPKQLIAWMGLGNARYRQQNFEAAEHAYEAALSLNPDSAAAHHNLAWALMRQHNYAAAAEPARTANQLADEQGDRYRSAWQAWQANDR